MIFISILSSTMKKHSIRIHKQPLKPTMFTSNIYFLFVAYLAVVNVGAASMFWYDKFQAQNNGWRVSESALHGTALLGGWVGGKVLTLYDRAMGD